MVFFLGFHGLYRPESRSRKQMATVAAKASHGFFPFTPVILRSHKTLKADPSLRSG
jgi:hypothetical protein